MNHVPKEPSVHYKKQSWARCSSLESAQDPRGARLRAWSFLRWAKGAVGSLEQPLGEEDVGAGAPSSSCRHRESPKWQHFTVKQNTEAAVPPRSGCWQRCEPLPALPRLLGARCRCGSCGGWKWQHCQHCQHRWGCGVTADRAAVALCWCQCVASPLPTLSFQGNSAAARPDSRRSSSLRAAARRPAPAPLAAPSRGFPLLVISTKSCFSCSWQSRFLFRGSRRAPSSPSVPGDGNVSSAALSR